MNKEKSNKEQKSYRSCIVLLKDVKVCMIDERLKKCEREIVLLLGSAFKDWLNQVSRAPLMLPRCFPVQPPRKLCCVRQICSKRHTMTQGTCCSLVTRMFSQIGRHAEYSVARDKSPRSATALESCCQYKKFPKSSKKKAIQSNLRNTGFLNRKNLAHSFEDE